MNKVNPIPRHVVIVMDGNGRWAKKRGLPRVAGHKAGAERITEILSASINNGIEVLTLWAFGTENWRRPQEEINYLMELMSNTIERKVHKLQEHNINFRVIGEKTRLPKKLQRVISQAEQMTKKNSGLKLVIAIDYSGRWDILQMVAKIAKEVEIGQLSAKEITEGQINKKMCLADLPEPDLFIRTSGEYRISNFFLWQLAFTELYFSKTLWPDFNEKEFKEALASYAKRDRRFGLIKT